MPRSKRALLRAGVFPIRNHYYEPQFDFSGRDPIRSPERLLPGIEWNVSGQTALLETLSFADELSDMPLEKPDTLRFYLNNGWFEGGDAEVWYQLLRLKKPKRVFEIGSGHSTLLALEAIRRNQEEDPAYQCKHLCVEPYERRWLEETKVTVVRKKVEEIGTEYFSELEANDFLFIDSSHIIRPEGDVLFEYLELLPSLKTGVIVHIHDIFSPRNYPDTWLFDRVTFWNEQYLLEAFLTHNTCWHVLASVNYLHHNHSEKLKEIAPFVTPETEPGSFYIQKHS